MSGSSRPTLPSISSFSIPPPEPPPSRRESLSKRRSVTVACEPCRKRKSKCDAARPTCFPCQRHDTHCVYETLGAETHSQALKRKHNELGARLDALTELYQLLRAKPEEDAQGMLQQIRSGVDPETLLRRIKESDLLMQLAITPPTEHCYEFPFMKTMPTWLVVDSNPYVFSKLYENTAKALVQQDSESSDRQTSHHASWERVYRIPYHACRLAEPLVDRVKPSEWTRVTSNDNLLRRLLETYFLSEFPFQSFFHKDFFLRDMAAGKERYCSSLLVNAVFASACHGNPGSNDRANFWEPHSLGYQFLAETKRLWELELGKNNITTVQAGGILCSVVSSNGMDKVGEVYMIQAIAMGKEMGIFGPLSHVRNKDRRKVYAVTAWTLFNLQSPTRFHLYKPPFLSQPPAEPLPTYQNARAYYGELYCKYPGSDDIVALYHGFATKAISEFRVIMNDVSVRLFSDSTPSPPPLSLEETLGYRSQLLDWHVNLPPLLSAQYIVFPSHLKIHMHYYNLLMSLFEPFVGEQTPLQQVPSETLRPNVEGIVKHCRVSLELLMRLYYLRHGFEHWDSLLLQFLMVQGFNSLRELYSTQRYMDSTQRNMILSTVLLCLKGLREQGNSVYLAEAVFTMMRGSIHPSDMEPLQLLFDIEKEEERKGLVAGQIRSNWPINIVSLADDPEQKRFDRLIEASADLNLRDDVSTSSGDSTSTREEAA